MSSTGSTSARRNGHLAAQPEERVGGDEPLHEPSPLPNALDRWELYRLLAEPVRLRLLALAAEEELTIGELAELLGEGQPNVSRHTAPLRQAGLVQVRKQGTRALVRLSEAMSGDPVVSDAVATGRSLCVDDGSLARVADVVRHRDAAARAYFARHGGSPQEQAQLRSIPAELGLFLRAVAPLIPQRALAVDAATGDGALLDVVAPLYQRVLAFDREEAQLARCRERLRHRGWSNVELLAGEVESEKVVERIHALGGADAVFAVRFLHHAPQPALALRALARLARPGGAIVVLDYARHDDERMRDQADLWLGFEADELLSLARRSGLVEATVSHLPPALAAAVGPDAHLAWQLLIARRPGLPSIPARDDGHPRVHTAATTTASTVLEGESPSSSTALPMFDFPEAPSSASPESPQDSGARTPGRANRRRS